MVGGHLRVLRLDVRENVVVEELQNDRDAVGEDQVLADVFELINVIDFQVLQKQQENGRHCLDDHFLRMEDDE